MHAQHILDHAPLGAFIRFSDGTPRPPDRHRRKLDDWETRNGRGQLTRKEAAKSLGSYDYPGGFSLHLGNYGANGVVVIVYTRSFQVTSPLDFEIDQLPVDGSVRVLTRCGDSDELKHLASDMAAAEAWLRDHHHYDVRLETVTSQTGGRAA